MNKKSARLKPLLEGLIKPLINSPAKPLLAPHLWRGMDAERAALAHLKARGLRLIARNYRCQCGELDIIMLDDNDLVFVEVRYRNSERFGGAIGSVDDAKQRKLRSAAEVFLQEYPPDAPGFDCRFDVVAMSGGSPYHIDWIKSAFD